MNHIDRGPRRPDAEAKAMFERDNEVRRIEYPDFEGSVYDRRWEDLQPYVMDLYLYPYPSGHRNI